MSKSLKNFVTIKECLQQFNARHIRFLCLMHRWDSPMNYSPDGETMQQAIDVDKGFLNFFSLAKAKIKAASPVSDFTQRWTKEDVELNEELRGAKKKVRDALLDNFDTPEALVSLQHLVSFTNTYLNTSAAPKAPLLKEVATFVMYMLRVFGIVTGSDEGFDYEDQGEEAKGLEPLMQCVGEFRKQVRHRANSYQSRSSSKARLAVSTYLSFRDKAVLQSALYQVLFYLAAKLSLLSCTGCAGGACIFNQLRTAVTTALRGKGGVNRGEENGKAPADMSLVFKDLLNLCDELRDEKLPSLGILLQDRPDGTFTYRISTK
ncbi:hypothetical protein Emag_006814 [Eimeria magna]